MGDIIKFSDMFGEPDTSTDPNEKSFAGLPQDEKEDISRRTKVYYNIFGVIRAMVKEIGPDKLSELLIDDIHLPITKEEVFKYVYVLRDCPPEDQWVFLYFTVCAVWQQIATDLTIPISFKHLDTSDTILSAMKPSGRAKLDTIKYTNYTAIVFYEAYRRLQKDIEKVLPELVDPSMNNLSASEAGFMEPFILITIAFLTIETAMLRVMDCSVINQWCKEYSLTSNDITSADIIESAMEFFGRRMRG